MECVSIADHRQTFFPVTFSEAGQVNKPTVRILFFAFPDPVDLELSKCEFRCTIEREDSGFGMPIGFGIPELGFSISDSGASVKSRILRACVAEFVKMQVASGGLLRNSHEFRYDLYTVRSHCPFF